MGLELEVTKGMGPCWGNNPFGFKKKREVGHSRHVSPSSPTAHTAPIALTFPHNLIIWALLPRICVIIHVSTHTKKCFFRFSFLAEYNISLLGTEYFMFFLGFNMA